MDDAWFLAAPIGFAAGLLSGQFGVGGGVITLPAIRLLLDRPELIAIGTPLPVIIPTALAGAVAYGRAGLVDRRIGVTVGLTGGLASVAGASLATALGGRVALAVVSVLIAWIAIDTARSALRDDDPADAGSPAVPHRGRGAAALLGLAAGLYSGFLGLGGGFVVVPALIKWFGFTAKRAVGTSLVAVAILAIPGSISHYVLGNVDLALAGALAAGVIPGALIGARITMRSSERAIRLGLAALLLVVGVLLAVNESGLAA